MPEASTTAAILSGRITRTGNDAAIAGAVVAVAPRQPVGYISDNGAAITVVSDADGRWTAQVRMPGTYELAATAKGYIPGSRSQIRVTAAAPVDGLDFVLEPGGTMVEGIVADTDGSPVNGARIVARIVAREDRGSPAFSALAGRDGRYSLTLAEGSYQLEAIHDEYASAWKNVTVGRDTATVDFSLRKGGVIRGRVIAHDTKEPVADALVDSFGRIEARTEAQGKFTISRLDALEYVLDARAPGYATTSGARVLVRVGEVVDGIELAMNPAFTIAGRVVQKGDPSRGVEGVMMNANIGPGGIEASAPSDADGRFEIPGAKPGEYFLIASKADLLHAEGQRVTIVDKDMLDVTIEVSTGVTIFGRVEPPTLATIGLLTEMEPAVYDPTKELNAQMARASTDASGAFTLRNVPDGTFQVSAMTRDGRVGTLPITVAGADQSGLVVQVTPRASIGGRVVDTNGKPIEGEYVHARLLYQRPTYMMRTDGYFPGVSSAADGSFKIVGLAPGNYSVIVDRNRAVDVTLDGATARTGIVLVVPARDGVIFGQVVDTSGKPVANAFVTAGRETSEAAGLFAPKFSFGESVTSDAAGRFTIEKLREGTYTVWAEYPRGGPHGARAGIKTGQSTTIEIEPLGSLSIDVTHNGARVSKFAVRCICLTSFGGGEVRDVAAPYTLERLPAGDYECEIDGDGGVTRAKASVRSGTETKLVVELSAWASLTGTVIGVTSGKPVSGIDVLVRGETVATDTSGRFVLARVPAGKGTVLLSARNAIPIGVDKRSYVAKPGERADLGTIKIVAPRTGEPGNLGFLLEVRTGLLAVTNVQTGGPAANAGLEVGDTILSIDGRQVSDLGVETANRLLGPGVVGEGQTVTLGLARGAAIAVTAAKWI